MAKKPEEIPKDKRYHGLTYRVTYDEDPVIKGDYIYDFTAEGLCKNPVFRCDTDFFAELINKEHQKPLMYRRSAKIVASNDPVLNAQGVPGLKIYY